MFMAARWLIHSSSGGAKYSRNILMVEQCLLRFSGAKIMAQTQFINIWPLRRPLRCLASRPQHQNYFTTLS
jgi:hypothetical protein